ncbi:MAG: hypothetical protein GY940_43180, partial [bacterium]|nr:hypothetical protein [bacterium]
MTMKTLFVSISFPYPPLKADSVFVYHMIKAMNDPGSVLTLSFSKNYNEVGRKVIENYSSEVVTIDGTKRLNLFRKFKGLLSKKPFSYHRYNFDKLETTVRKLCGEHSIGRIIFVDSNLMEMGYRLRDLDMPLFFHTIDSISNNLGLRFQFEKRWPRKIYFLNQAAKWRRFYKRCLPYFS